MFNYVELQLCFGNSALQILLSGCFTVDENTGERSKTIKDTKIRGKALSHNYGCERYSCMLQSLHLQQDIIPELPWT